MIAAVLLIGDELLGGTISDRNLAQVARAFGPRGVPVTHVEIVRDDPTEIVDAVRRLAAKADVLVTTGGLGPTVDDITRDAFAQALGVETREDPDARAAILARAEQWRITPTEDAVRRQSTFPVGATVVPNPVGSAPGFTGMLGNCRYWVLPGVPQEVTEMLPIVAAALPPARDGHDWERMVATAGRGETLVADRLEQAGFETPPGVQLAYLPSPGGVRLRLFARAGAPVEDLDAAEARLRELIAEWVLPGPSVEASLVAALAERSGLLATAESCTGGLVGGRITDVPGASVVYRGGTVAYANDVKTTRLGLDPALLAEHGAVSEWAARAMAIGAREAFGATLGVSVTGVAGPGGGTPEKPVGTVWIGVADAEGEEVRRFRFPGNREMVRERTVNKALEMAYLRVAKPGTGA